MIIATVIYVILAVMLAINRHNILKAKLDFGSAEVARYASLVAVKGMFKIVTVIYLVSMICMYFW